jgi:hypothetical protein
MDILIEQKKHDFREHGWCIIWSKGNEIVCIQPPFHRKIGRILILLDDFDLIIAKESYYEGVRFIHYHFTGNIITKR